MKFKHLLFVGFIAMIIASCSKDNGHDFTFTIPAVDTSGTGGATTPVSGITLGADAAAYPATGDNSNNLFGNPTAGGTNDDYILNQGYYVESYSSSRQEPNWVSWHLDNTNTTNVTQRTDAFAGFSGLPQGFFVVQSDSYDYATFGFDRGHNCPSADRTSSVIANKATFLMTNMIPQAPNNNQQTWGNFEDYLRSLTTTGNEVYIIMGSYGTGGIGLKGSTVNTITMTKYANEKINVPSNVWKVAVVLPVGNGDLNRVTKDTRVIAINTPNINSINSNWKQYITTIDAIEKASAASTGATAGQKVTILSALPSSVRDVLKVKVDPGS